MPSFDINSILIGAVIGGIIAAVIVAAIWNSRMKALEEDANNHLEASLLLSRKLARVRSHNAYLEMQRDILISMIAGEDTDQVDDWSDDVDLEANRESWARARSYLNSPFYLPKDIQFPGHEL